MGNLKAGGKKLRLKRLMPGTGNVNPLAKYHKKDKIKLKDVSGTGGHVGGGWGRQFYAMG